MKTHSHLGHRYTSPYYWRMERENLFALYRRKKNGHRELINVFSQPDNAEKECKAWLLTDQIILKRIELAEEAVPRKTKPKDTPWHLNHVAYVLMLVLLLNGAAKFMKAAEVEVRNASNAPLKHEPPISAISAAFLGNH